MDSIQTVILAAGHGKRMNSDLPKVLLPLKGIPLIKRLISAVEGSRLTKPPVIVVGQGADQVKAALGDKYNYVFQDKQLGTGHAVLSTKEFLKNDGENIMVLYGDHPLVSAETINTIAEAHYKSGSVLTMATVVIDDFNDWRAAFNDYGRIIRNGGGKIDRIIEKKDATEEEKLVKEVNPSYFCFKANWLWKNLDKITNENSQREYYLTTLPHIAKEGGETITTVVIEPHEALGANTPEQLKLLEQVMDIV
jgi:bifunctional UDP-N-acetylglucosamine pyrophosphorylase / glucosamine-1-phosphate N-acetyltransferase